MIGLVYIILDIFQMQRGGYSIDYKDLNKEQINQHVRVIGKGEEAKLVLNFPLVKNDGTTRDYYFINRQGVPSDVSERTEKELPLEIVDSQGHTYELVASGISLGGHAIAHVKEEGQWMNCNDSAVNAISKEEAMRSMRRNGITFLYRKKCG